MESSLIGHIFVTERKFSASVRQAARQTDEGAGIGPPRRKVFAADDDATTLPRHCWRIDPWNHGGGYPAGDRPFVSTDVVREDVDGADERKWIQRARVLTVFWGILSFAAAFFVLHFGTVVTAGIKLATVIIGALFGIFLLGLFSRRANATGTVIGAVAGMSVLIVFIATSPLSWTWYCLIGTGVTVAVGFVASLFGRPPERPLTYWDLPPASPGGTAKQAGKP